MDEGPRIAPDRLSTRTVHVVYFDRVQSTSIPLERRVRLDDALREFVQSLPEVQEASAKNELIQIDTGDGLALVFQGDPQLAAASAIALGEYSHAHAEHPLRIAAHSGTVTIRKGLAATPSVAGPGIDVAAHLMHTAQPNVPMFSGSLADLLLPLEAWANLLRDVGTVEIKHARQIRVYQPADAPVVASQRHTQEDAEQVTTPSTAHSPKVLETTASTSARPRSKRLWTFLGVLLVGVCAFAAMKFFNVTWTEIYFADFRAPIYENGHRMAGEDRWHCPETNIVVEHVGQDAWAKFQPGDGVLIGVDKEFRIKKLRFAMEFRVDVQDWPDMPENANYGYNVNLNRDNDPTSDRLQIWMQYVVKHGQGIWYVVDPRTMKVDGPSPQNHWIRADAEWDPQAQLVTYRLDGKTVAQVPTSASPDRFIRLIQIYADRKGMPGMRVRLLRLEYVTR